MQRDVLLDRLVKRSQVSVGGARLLLCRRLTNDGDTAEGKSEGNDQGDQREHRLEFSQGGRNGKARGANRWKQSADESHQERIAQTDNEQLRRYSESECYLTEGLEVHRRGLIAIECHVRAESANDSADGSEHQ